MLREGRTADGVLSAAAVPDGVALDVGGEVAVLFPGQGSQRPGMLADLFAAFPRLADLLARGAEWTSRIYPPSSFDADGRAAAAVALKDTRVAQPALGIAGLAMYRTLSELGLRPAHLAGHSYGELVALTAAGALNADELLDLSAAGGRAILPAARDDPGTMAAVAASAAQVRSALNGTPVVIANINSPQQTVISGTTPAIAEAVAVLKKAGLRAVPIPVACAFHSPVVADAVRTLETELATRSVGSPHLPVWSNATATPYPLGAGRVREMIAEQVVSPVRFAEQIEAMYAAGARVFVECGPGGVLTGLVGAILGDKPHLAVATDAEGRHSVHTLLTALGRLAVAGFALEQAPLYAGRDTAVVSPTDVPRRAGWTVDGHLVRTADGVPVAGGLRPAERVTAAARPVVTPEPTRRAKSSGADAVVLEFLRNSRELLAAQRDVVLGFLAGAPAAASPAPAPTPASAPAAVIPAQAGRQETVVAQPTEPTLAATTPAVDVLSILTELISERTGYPIAMLDADLDLEADLSIGSRKRTEIVALLADKLRDAGVENAPDESRQATLTRIRTMRGIVEALDAGPAPEAAPAPAHHSSPEGAAAVARMLTELISERTGYPIAMLDADLDLEADLSIGSLKRTEIIALLADKLREAGLDCAPDEAEQSELTRIQTMRGIVTALCGERAADPPLEFLTPAPSAPAESLPAPRKALPAGQLTPDQDLGRTGRAHWRAHRLPGGHARRRPGPRGRPRRSAHSSAPRSSACSRTDSAARSRSTRPCRPS